MARSLTLQSCILLFFTLSILCQVNDQISFEQQKSLVIIIPSYNNQRYYKQNLDSVFYQLYDNYRVIYIDDCSNDGTYNLVNDYIENLPGQICSAWEHLSRDLAKESRITFIRNKQRLGALQNLYNAIHSCKDYEIVITLDGDD